MLGDEASDEEEGSGDGSEYVDEGEEEEEEEEEEESDDDSYTPSRRSQSQRSTISFASAGRPRPSSRASGASKISRVSSLPSSQSRTPSSKTSKTSTLSRPTQRKGTSRIADNEQRRQLGRSHAFPSSGQREPSAASSNKHGVGGQSKLPKARTLQSSRLPERGAKTDRCNIDSSGTLTPGSVRECAEAIDKLLALAQTCILSAEAMRKADKTGKCWDYMKLKTMLVNNAFDLFGSPLVHLGCLQVILSQPDRKFGVG